MHPILKTRARLGTYLLGWVPVALLLVAAGVTNGWSWPGAAGVALPLCLLGAFLFLSSWYLCRAFPLEAPPKGRWSAWIAAAFALGNLWAGLAWALARFWARFPSTRIASGNWLAPWGLFATIGTLLYLATLALHYLLMALEQRQEAERSEQELRLLAREAELKALRAQLNPHFLFNSLNSISALTTVDPGRAREMCVLLADFLRTSLRLGQRQAVSLSEELELARNYLATERIRFGTRLGVVWEIVPGLEETEVPTLLLQPLVENAIKHGIAQLPEGGTIRISAARHGAYVEIQVENPADPDAEAPQGLGLGLTQVHQRLLGRFGTRSYFDARLREGRHLVVLGLPTEAKEAP